LISREENPLEFNPKNDGIVKSLPAKAGRNAQKMLGKTRFQMRRSDEAEAQPRE
jgi:hypothetical protein